MILIKSPQNLEEYRQYYELRYQVLREPWGQVRGTEKDDYEPVSDHFMALEQATGKLVGVVKLFEKEPGLGWVSHMAVTSTHQRKGIGKLLMAKVEERARERGMTRLGCFSRLTTTEYFKRMGFEIAGLPTRYFGNTQVVWMEKELKG
mgnify:CR=1 FL=1